MELVAEEGLRRRLAPPGAAQGKGRPTALACGLTLVSNDVDLRRVPGLQVVDWRAVR
jgi:predicted nucleic acid-binding protein